MANIKTYEKNYQALLDVVEGLEKDDLTLHEMLKEYKKGLQYAEACSLILKAAQEEVDQLIEEIHIADE